MAIKRPERCGYCEGSGKAVGGAECGFCDNGVPLDTQEDWDRSWGRVLALADEMVAIAKANACEHRYPKPNTAGFPEDQCLDCGAWRRVVTDEERQMMDQHGAEQEGL